MSFLSDFKTHSSCILVRAIIVERPALKPCLHRHLEHGKDAFIMDGIYGHKYTPMSNSNLLYGPSGLKGAFSLRERSIITISFATQHSHDFFSIFSSLFFACHLN